MFMALLGYIVGTQASNIVPFTHPEVIENLKHPLGRRDTPEIQCPASQKVCDQSNYCAEVCCGYGYGGMYVQRRIQITLKPPIIGKPLNFASPYL